MTDKWSKYIPDGEVAILVVNQSRNTTVGVVLGVLGSLLLLLSEVKVDGLVGKSKLLEHNGNLPEGERTERENRIIVCIMTSSSPAIGTALVGEESELFAVRHGRSVAKRLRFW